MKTLTKQANFLLPKEILDDLKQGKMLIGEKIVMKKVFLAIHTELGQTKYFVYNPNFEGINELITFVTKLSATL